MNTAGRALSPRPVTPGGPDWPLVEAFLHETADPVMDLLLWADVASNLARLSRVWVATDGDQVLGVVYAFPLWPEWPSVGVKGRSADTERAMLAALVDAGELTRGFVITAFEQEPVFAATGAVSGRFEEIHMVLKADAWAPRPLTGVRPGTLDELDAFYRAQDAGAWNPVQVETGPYFVAEEAGEVVAAAGSHFAFPGLAQVGNVLTCPDQRGRGHAERLTAAVTQALIERGHPVISLFVAADNAGARRIYQRLGFTDLRPLAAFRWEAARS